MSKTLVHQDVIKLMEKWAPKAFAFDWDPVGLQVGSMTDHLNHILVTLDVTEAVVDEAIKNDANLIIAHHPLLFRPVKHIDTDSVQGKVLKKLLKHDITVYASHTNLDVAPGGVNDLLGKEIGLSEVTILDETGEEPLFKVVVYVPEDHADAVRSALGKAGGGFIGDYSHCTFNTAGKGTFKPTDQATPFIGEIDELTVVEETKIETVVPKSGLNVLIQAMLKAHPYEEAAYDVYEMANEGVKRGIGRIGDLPEQMTLQELADRVKSSLDVPMVRTVGDLSKPIKTVAVLGGSGEKFISAALTNGADVLITGDLTFHAAQDALEAGMTLIDPGHHVENVMKSATKAYLDHNLGDHAGKVYISEVNTEPFQFV